MQVPAKRVTPGTRRMIELVSDAYRCAATTLRLAVVMHKFSTTGAVMWLLRSWQPFDMQAAAPASNHGCTASAGLRRLSACLPSCRLWQGAYYNLNNCESLVSCAAELQVSCGWLSDACLPLVSSSSRGRHALQCTPVKLDLGMA